MIICADDYGISPAVSVGIIELIEHDKISATSCMMLGGSVGEMMQRLRPFADRVDIGLHLVLTDETPLSRLGVSSGLVDAEGDLLPFRRLLINCYKKVIDYQAVCNEIRAQLDLFVTLVGQQPDYIDGHQHTHQLPVVREAVANAIQYLQERNRRAYVRVAGLPTMWLLKTGLAYSSSFAFNNLMIGLPGKAMARLMDRSGVPRNRFLLGFYDYEGKRGFDTIVRLYLTLKPNDRDIFFCHPGYVDDELRSRDCVVDSRLDVLEFLKSSRIQQLMNEAGVRMNRFL